MHTTGPRGQQSPDLGEARAVADAQHPVGTPSRTSRRGSRVAWRRPDEAYDRAYGTVDKNRCTSAICLVQLDAGDVELGETAEQDSVCAPTPEPTSRRRLVAGTAGCRPSARGSAWWCRRRAAFVVTVQAAGRGVSWNRGYRRRRRWSHRGGRGRRAQNTARRRSSPRWVGVGRPGDVRGLRTPPGLEARPPVPKRRPIRCRPAPASGGVRPDAARVEERDGAEEEGLAQRPKWTSPHAAPRCRTP